MATIPLKLPDPLALRLAEARKSTSAIILDGQEAYLSAGEPHPEGSALALAANARGVPVGPAHLSCNRKPVRDFGR